jgi:hypothetical protein
VGALGVHVELDGGRVLGVDPELVAGRQGEPAPDLCLDGRRLGAGAAHRAVQGAQVVDGALELRRVPPLHHEVEAVPAHRPPGRTLGRRGVALGHRLEVDGLGDGQGVPAAPGREGGHAALALLELAGQRVGLPPGEEGGAAHAGVDGRG